MELCVVWILASVLVLRAYGNLPIPVLLFQDRIVEDDDTLVTCVLPGSDFPDAELVIKANATITSCIPQRGSFPNVTCTVEVTKDMHGMEFTCEAKIKTQSPPKPMYIQTEPEFTDCPGTYSWIEGQENSFHCKAKGYPPPAVTCDKNGTIYREGEKFTAMRNMSGEYTCRATNFDTVRKPVSVSVEYKPQILGVRFAPPLRAEGDKVEITCEAAGLPEPSYSWITPNPTDVRSSPDNRTLTIQRLSTFHLGDYTCAAQNIHGSDSAKQELRLEVAPTISRFTVKPSTEVFEGDNVTLTCEATGFPPPVLSWTTPKHDMEISQDKSTITIRGVNKGHAGSYTCMSKNKHGMKTRSETLSLAVKPKIQKILVDPSASLAEGANATLTCVAEGEPRPTYSWETPNPDVQFSPDKSSVKIWNAKTIHEGDYTCRAENKHGPDTMTEKITVKVTESKGNRGERSSPVTVTLITMLISTSLVYYL